MSHISPCRALPGLSSSGLDLDKSVRVPYTLGRGSRKTPPLVKGPDAPAVENGRRLAAPKGTVPSFHGFRHTAASEAIAAGESAEEVSWQLGHKSSLVTRAVYIQEVKSAERTARRRARMEARYGSVLEAAEHDPGQQTSDRPVAEVLDLGVTVADLLRRGA
jgi:hypothetical protein